MNTAIRSASWIITFVLLATFCGCKTKEEDAPKPVVDVKVARAETEDVRLSLRAPATVFPREQANVASRMTAPIRELRVRKGDAVSAGQVLAVLENRDLVAQRQEAAASVTDARANLEKTSAGTLPTDLERARGQLATAEAALNQAQKIYEKRQQLFKEGAIPGRDLLISETDFSRAKTDFEVSKKAYDLLLHQSGQRDVQMARSRLEQAQARLSSARIQVQFSDIRSPFSGVITDQFVYPGDMAKPDSPMFTVMDLSLAIARAQVPESQAPVLRQGLACSFEPADAVGTSFPGRVSVISRAVDPARRTVEVWCEIPKPPRSLRAGAFGNVAVETGVQPGSIVVPQAAVQFAEGTNKGTVMVVDGKHIAHKREVETGGASGGKVQIKSGLRAGETVVVEGGYGLPDGAEVRVEESKP
jgi:HlyD family secretion protein